MTPVKTLPDDESLPHVSELIEADSAGEAQNREVKPLKSRPRHHREAVMYSLYQCEEVRQFGRSGFVPVCKKSL